MNDLVTTAFELVGLACVTSDCRVLYRDKAVRGVELTWEFDGPPKNIGQWQKCALEWAQVQHPSIWVDGATECELWVTDEWGYVWNTVAYAQTTFDFNA